MDATAGKLFDLGKYLGGKIKAFHRGLRFDFRYCDEVVTIQGSGNRL